MKVTLDNGISLKVWVNHVNPNSTFLSKEQMSLLNKYGYGTFVSIYENDKLIGEGRTRLHKEDKDKFNRHVGLKMALTQALAEAGIQKSDRTQIWNSVFGNKYKV